MSSALNTQVGGTHYKKYKIQPIQYIQENGLDFCQGSVVKYITRFRDKNGLEDLTKAKHFIDLIIDAEYKSSDSETRLDKLRNEYDDLLIKIDKLDQLLCTCKNLDLPSEEVDDLNEQSWVMKNYAEVLTRRIKRLEESSIYDK